MLHKLYFFVVLSMLMALPAFPQYDDEPLESLGAASGPETDDDLEANVNFPFFSHFFLGAGQGTTPFSLVGRSTTTQSLFYLNLGVHVPFWIEEDSAFAAGLRVVSQYPTYLSIQEGEANYYFDVGPNFEYYKNILRNKEWDVDVIGGLSWNFRRTQYAIGTLSSQGPSFMVGTKVRWLPYMVLDSTPVVNLRFNYNGLLNSYTASRAGKDNPVAGNLSASDFSGSGSMSGMSFEVSTGLSAPSAIIQTENEFLVGMFLQSTQWSRLKKSTLNDVNTSYTALFLAWRRTWVR